MPNFTITTPCTIAREIAISPGTYADAKTLAPFHYRPGRPAGVLRIFRAIHQGHLCGVLVETLPLLASAARNSATGERFALPDALLAAALLNDEMRCIARVIVHPVYRGLGLAVRLVRHALAHAETPYVEAFAAMGRVHPFFEHAGMTPHDHVPSAADARMTAALAHLNLTPMDLCNEARSLRILKEARAEDRAFLLAELHRHSNYSEARNESQLELLLAQARRRLLSHPIYYLWQSREHAIPAAISEPRTVRER